MIGKPSVVTRTLEHAVNEVVQAERRGDIDMDDLAHLEGAMSLLNAVCRRIAGLAKTPA